MKEKFLPIGTVVLLKGGEKEVMITSYCIFPTNKQIKNGEEVAPEKKLYEYGGCLYPEGILDSNTVCAFNHEQIEKICFTGYESEKQKELSNKLNEVYKTFKEQYENGTQG